MLQQGWVKHTPASEQPDSSCSLSALWFSSLLFVHINKCCVHSVRVVNSHICGNVPIFSNQNNCASGHGKLKLVLSLQGMRLCTVLTAAMLLTAPPLTFAVAHE